MAYITCPWCLTPQLTSDDAAEYRCFTCYGEIGFFSCPNCSLVQTVSKKWNAFTCGKCNQKIALPHRWGYADGSRAYKVRGTGKSWPPL